MKDSGISSESSDSFSNKSCEAVEQVSSKLVQNLDDLSNKSKINFRGIKQSVDSYEIQNIQASSQSTDSFSVKSSEIAAEPIETSVSQIVEEISNEESMQILKTDSKLEIQNIDAITIESKDDLSKTELSHFIEEDGDSKFKLSFDTKVEPLLTKETEKIEFIQQTESIRTTEYYTKDKTDAEDSSSSRITGDSETLDNFTDVPTHTVTSETSDAYLDLESDHSFEEIESLQVEGESTGLQEVHTTDASSMVVELPKDASVTECYENSLSRKDILEDADDFALDTIPENELENYEEEEYSLSEHFEISEDELIYPLPYNDDWIEQSFELKEYGVEAEFFESESDIHGLGITHEDYDDEDIQRAIDYNLSTFDDNEGDVENVITTESFKTLSHDASPHLKPDEYDTWSTGDAPSIEEEFAEQDNVLSKIDEILAEDFDDMGIYQADSYLKHDQEVEDYLPKDISALGDTGDDFIQSDKISLTKSDSETIHKVTKLDTGQILKTELDIESEGLFQKKESTKAFESESENISDEIKVLFKPSLTADSETRSDELIMQKESSQILKIVSDSLRKDTTEFKTFAAEEEITKIDSESIDKIHPKSTSDKIIQETICEMPKIESNIELSDTYVDKNAIQIFEEESTSLSPEVVVMKDSVKIESEFSSELTIKRDSKLMLKSDSATVSDEIILKKSTGKVSKAESNISSFDVVSHEITSDKDFAGESKIKSESICGEVTVKGDYIESSKAVSESVSSEINIKKVSKPESKPDSDSAFETLKMTVKKTSEKGSKIESDVTLESKLLSESKIKSESVCGEITVKKDYAETSKSESEAASSAVSLQKESKLEVKPLSETASDELTLQKISERDSKIEKAELKQDSDRVSDETLMKDYKKDLKVDSDIVSSEIIVKKDSVSQRKLVSDSVSGEIIIKKDSEQQIKLKQDLTEKDTFLLKSTDKVPDEVSSIIKTTSDQIKILAESSEKAVESKDISSSLDASTAVISSSINIHKTLKDQFSDVATSSVSKTDSSTDIPLTKSEEIQKEPSVSYKALKESEITEPPTCSLLSESPSESTEVQLNIPEETVCKDETYSIADATTEKQISSDALVVEVKPDIPKKTKQKSLDLTETTPIREELDKKPSLPPKKSKRHSLTDSASSSFGESLSSSSSAESIGSFESAISDKSRKSSQKSSDETSMHSLSPEAPTRRSRSSKTSSSRSTSRDSEDSSSCSRSSSLKIRRRSSNFAEPEPIDLSKKRASIDERMKKLQIEGKCTTKEKAFIAAKLIEMQFEEEDALLASRQCNTVYHAVKFLTQLCDMCNCRFPINLMSSLVNCTHRACKECLKAHFTALIYDRSVFTLLCPICHKPDITDQNIQEYFTHLDMTLRNILEDKVYDLFQRKLRDEVLTKDPNFHWCSQCSSGFIASPRLKKLYCPDCSAITCAMCHQTWELEHEGVHCERFQQWKDMHTPEPPPAGLVKFLTDRGISCPSCGLVYAQACGGCMMYKCSHCSFEFCGFCIRPLKKGRECSNEICDSRGHHVHHLHNCLFFLRDKDITEIQMLLEEESITYFTIPPKNQIVKTRCQVREQKNNHGILTEDRCGRPIEPYCGGLCRTHYYEYLTELLRKNNISPLSIMTIQDLQFMLRKSRIFVPEKVKGETSEDYYERLLEFVTKSLT